MRIFVKTTLAVAMMALSAPIFAADAQTNPAANPAAITPAEKTKIEEVVHQYLLKNPEVLVEALKVYQEQQFKQAELTVKETQKNAGQFTNALFHQANDPVGGNPQGTITVVEFFDYQCPHCVDMAPVMESIVKSNPNVRIVYKEFPIRGPMSDFASRAALAANKQGKYVQFSKALLASNQPLTQALVFELAKQNGLDVEKLKKDMSDKSIDDQLKANVKLAQELKLFGTPAFFIGKTNTQNGINYVPGQMNQNQLQDLINQASK